MLENPMNEQLMLAQDTLLNFTTNLYLLAVVVLVASYLMYLLASRIILVSLKKLFKQTATHVDDVFVEQGAIHRLAYFVPLLVIYASADLFPEYSDFIRRFLSAALVVVLILFINAVLDAVNVIYSQSKFAEGLNIKSYLQISKLLLNIFGGIIAIAIVINKTPVYLLSGIGALTAVLLLIF